MAKKPDVQTWLDYGIDFETRTIYLGTASKDSEIDAKTAEQLIKGLMALNWRNKDPITLIINSPGGSIDHRNAIFDAIKQSDAKVIGLVLGCAMSAAATILQACDVRLMAPNATLMFHSGTWAVKDSVNSFKAWAAEASRIEDWDQQLILGRMKEKHPKTTLKQVQDYCAQDWIMTATEAVEYGLADEVLK